MNYINIRNLVMISATALSLTVSAALKHCAFLTNCDNNRSASQILLFEVSSSGWQYVRTFMHPFDGHCRIPMAAVLVGDVVYVSEWCGWDDRSAANPSSARILKYDLNGRYLGVLVDEILDPNGKKVNRIESMIASHDGKYLYLCQPFNGVNNQLRFYRYKISDGTGGHILDRNFNCPYGISETSDGKMLFVANRHGDSADSGDNVFAYEIKEDGFERKKTYFKKKATSAYLDEETGFLYVTGYGSGISVFDFNSNSKDPIATLNSTSTYSQVKKIDGVLYAVCWSSGTIFKLSRDKTDNSKIVGENMIHNRGVKDIYNLNYTLMFNDFEIEDSVTEVARYKFDEPVNSPVCENSVSGDCPVRTFRAQTGAKGVSGGALCFSETCSRAILEGAQGLLGSEYGIFMWFGVKDDSQYVGHVFSNRMMGNNVGRLSLIMDQGRLRFYNGFINSIDFKVPDGAPLINDGKWHHIGVVKKGNTVSLWLDGEKRVSCDVNALGVDDAMEFTLGASHEGYDGYLKDAFMDDLRIFDGAPTDDAVKAMYDEYKDVAASIEVLSSPELPVHDSSAATPYGTVVSHSFAHQTPRTPPAVAVQSNGDWWVTFGSRTMPSSKDSKGSARVSSDRGATWRNWTDNVYVYYAAPFECKEDGVLYALGRTAYDRGTTGYSICYNNPTNGCEGRVGFSSFTFQDGKKHRTGFYTNDINRAVIRVANKMEPDLATEQEIYPGAGAVIGARFYLPYLAKDKVGLVSGAVTRDAGISDFRGEVASVISKAEKPFPGPVFAGLDGKVSVLVPSGVNGSGVATVDMASRDAIGDELTVVEEGIALPGADRPFAVRYDSVRRQYWAATTPGGTSLCLYASRDLKEWGLAKTVFTVSNPETTRVSNPAFDVSGSDLVVAFNLSAPDGGPALRSLDDPNYVMVRKVSSFRRESPWQNGTVFILR